MRLKVKKGSRENTLVSLVINIISTFKSYKVITINTSVITFFYLDIDVHEVHGLNRIILDIGNVLKVIGILRYKRESIAVVCDDGAVMNLTLKVFIKNDVS